MTSCGESSDGPAPKKLITSRQPPNRNRPPRPRGQCRHVHPLTTFRPTFPLQHPTFVTRIPGPRWRSAGRRLCRPQRRALPGSSGSPSDPAAASANRLPLPCPPRVGPTARRRERHATPGRCRRPTEVTARRGTSRPSASPRPAFSVLRCLQAQLRNRTLSHGPLADTRPDTRRGSHRAAHTPSESGPTNWFRRAPSLRVADGVLRFSRPRSDW
jgi:hypothetical protein